MKREKGVIKKQQKKKQKRAINVTIPLSTGS